MCKPSASKKRSTTKRRQGQTSNSRTYSSQLRKAYQPAIVQQIDEHKCLTITLEQANLIIDAIQIEHQDIRARYQVAKAALVQGLIQKYKPFQSRACIVALISPESLHYLGKKSNDQWADDIQYAFEILNPLESRLLTIDDIVSACRNGFSTIDNKQISLTYSTSYSDYQESIVYLEPPNRYRIAAPDDVERKASVTHAVPCIPVKWITSHHKINIAKLQTEGVGHGKMQNGTEYVNFSRIAWEPTSHENPSKQLLALRSQNLLNQSSIQSQNFDQDNDQSSQQLQKSNGLSKVGSLQAIGQQIPQVHEQQTVCATESVTKAYSEPCRGQPQLEAKSSPSPCQTSAYTCYGYSNFSSLAVEQQPNQTQHHQMQTARSIAADMSNIGQLTSSQMLQQPLPSPVPYCASIVPRSNPASSTTPQYQYRYIHYNNFEQLNYGYGADRQIVTQQDCTQKNNTEVQQSVQFQPVLLPSRLNSEPRLSPYDQNQEQNMSDFYKY